MNDQHASLDIISTLPSNIIETILCLVPIEDAGRTSIISRKWRYNWLTIPKLEFIQKDFQVTSDEEDSDEDLRSDLEKTFNSPSERRKMTRRCKLFYAIYQVLLSHRGPIHEFSLYMDADDGCVEIDHIILHLSRNYTVKKFKLDLIDYRYDVPLSIYSFHQLTDLYLCKCCLYHRATKLSNGFGSLTSLYLEEVSTNTETFLHLISNSPLLKSLTLILSCDDFYEMYCEIHCELFKLLPVIEHLTITRSAIECLGFEPVPRQLPTSFAYLKYFCLQDMCFIDEYGLPFLVLLIRSAPNLEKIKLPIWHHKSETDSLTLEEDYSDICLEHLKEVEIENFNIWKPELEFVKLILAKSPVLKRMSIVVSDKVTMNKEVKMLRILLRSPRASPVVDIIVERPHDPHGRNRH